MQDLLLPALSKIVEDDSRLVNRREIKNMLEVML